MRSSVMNYNRRALTAFMVSVLLFAALTSASFDVDGDSPLTIDQVDYDPGLKMLSVSGTAPGSTIVIGQISSGDDVSPYFDFDVVGGRYEGKYNMAGYKVGKYELLIFVSDVAKSATQFEVVDVSIAASVPSVDVYVGEAPQSSMISMVANPKRLMSIPIIRRLQPSAPCQSQVP